MKWNIVALSFFFICIIFLVLFPSRAFAGNVLGVHLLNIGELGKAAQLLKDQRTKDDWTYVTIPLTLDDLSKPREWQAFFDRAKQQKFLPIVRLATRFNQDKQAWEIPTQKDVVDLSAFLSTLNWPKDDEKLVIVFNEPNHSAEWGGVVQPDAYARILAFTTDWLHSENQHFVMLPAGMDLAAPNGNTTMEAMNYLKQMQSAVTGIFDQLDAWNSHSYPNPGFEGAPMAMGQNSLHGYTYELAFLHTVTDKTFPVYITETGWVDSSKTNRWLNSYYMYAVKNVWSDPKIKAVTPFVLEGAPGMFAPFSFYDALGQPTKQFYALRNALELKD